MSLVGPAKLSDRLYEGSRKVVVDPLIIAIRGDVASLSGRTVYAIVEVADPLFEARPNVSLTPPGRQWS